MKWLYYFLGTAIAAYLIAHITTPDPMPTPINDLEIICYACGRGESPENTFEGIAHCQSVNPDWRIEMDIQITRDGHLVLFHDYNMERITGQNVEIKDLTLVEVQQLNAGYHFQKDGAYPYRDSSLLIPTVEDVFARYPDARLMLDVHADDPRAIEKLISLIDQYGRHQDIIVSHYDEVIAAFRERKPRWTYGVPAGEAKKMLYSSFLYLDGLFPIKSDILMLPQQFGKINVLSSRVINHAKKRNKRLYAWMYEGDTVKNIETLSDLETMSSLGVDGVFVDRPSELTDLIKRMR